jgi:hypothetical protein
MVQLLVLISVEKVSVFDIVKMLTKMPEIREAFPTFGRFDVAAFFDVAKRDDIGPLVKRISTLDGVLKTETLVEL